MQGYCGVRDGALWKPEERGSANRRRPGLWAAAATSAGCRLPEGCGSSSRGSEVDLNVAVPSCALALLIALRHMPLHLLDLVVQSWKEMKGSQSVPANAGQKVGNVLNPNARALADRHRQRQCARETGDRYQLDTERNVVAPV